MTANEAVEASMHGRLKTVQKLRFKIIAVIESACEKGDRDCSVNLNNYIDAIRDELRNIFSDMGYTVKPKEQDLWSIHLKW